MYKCFRVFVSITVVSMFFYLAHFIVSSYDVVPRHIMNLIGEAPGVNSIQGLYGLDITALDKLDSKPETKKTFESLANLIVMKNLKNSADDPQDSDENDIQVLRSKLVHLLNVQKKNSFKSKNVQFKSYKRHYEINAGKSAKVHDLTRQKKNSSESKNVQFASYKEHYEKNVGHLPKVDDLTMQSKNSSNSTNIQLQLYKEHYERNVPKGPKVDDLTRIENSEDPITSNQDQSKDSVNYRTIEEVRRWFPGKTAIASTVSSDFIIKPDDFCPDSSRLDYIVIVHSAIEHFIRRRAIRGTYGQRRIFKNIDHRVVFFLGTTTNYTATKLIQYEATYYGDIVQGDFVDTYHNLTLKGVMAFRWINEFCPNVNLVIKIDDDVFINVFRIFTILIPVFANRKHTIGCTHHKRNEKTILRQGGKWHVEPLDFAGMRNYPMEHCDGFFVALSGDLIPDLVNASRVSPFFWIDDVYLFGMLPYTIGDVKFLNMQSHMTFSSWEGRNCIAKFGVYCQYLAVSNNNFRITHFTNLWKYITRKVTQGVKNWYKMVDEFPVSNYTEAKVNVFAPIV